MLKLFSEPFSATGGLAGAGASKLLGTPNLSPIEVLIRETAQNSIDAARPGFTVEYSVHLRQPDEVQQDYLRGSVFSGLPFSAESRHVISQSLSKRGLKILEIKDRGTWGLGGPTSPDVIPEDSSSLDFVNFVRNIGAVRDRPGGGGTYGFGKTATYAFSRCRAVVIYSRVALPSQRVESRLIACHLGNEFGVKENGLIRKYTGRHWWGLPTSDGVDPITGRTADEVARRIGIDFLPEDTGTSLLIVDPDIDDENTFEGRLKEAMLFHLWPKMIAESGGPAPVTFIVDLYGRRSSPPRPEEFPPLHAYAKCLKSIKEKTDGVQIIKCGKPKAHLGSIALSRFERLPRKQLVPKELSLFPENMSHIALMRPVELVVTYREGKKDPSGDIEWGGVFVCSDEEEIEKAFAQAEPPSHDDWQPKYLKQKRYQTFVRVALREIDRASIALVDHIDSGPSDASDVHIGKLADRLGGLLMGLKGDGRENVASRMTPKKRVSVGARGGRTSNSREVQLLVDGVEESDDGRIVTLRLTNIDISRITELKAEIALSVDGRAAPGWLDEIDNESRVLGWYSTEGELISTNPHLHTADIDDVSKLKVFVTGAAVEIAVQAKTETADAWE